MVPEKILILEDDPDIAHVYEAALRLDGKDVTVCTRFEDARQQLKSAHPDAVLTDVRVGAYNGLQLALLFRSVSPQGRVVVITGYDDGSIRKEVEHLDGEFLLKPVKISTLRGAFTHVDNTLSSPRSR
jgi:DNA-binding NtrC family response regulator